MVGHVHRYPRAAFGGISSGHVGGDASPTRIWPKDFQSARYNLKRQLNILAQESDRLFG